MKETRDELLIYFYLLFYLNNCPSLLLDLRESPPITELFPIYEGTPLTPNCEAFCKFLLLYSNSRPNFLVYFFSAIFGLIILFTLFF